MPPRNLIINPRFWPTWLQLALLRLIASLPMGVQYILGRIFGRVLYLCLARRRHVVKTNIAICFPNLEASAQKQLAIEVFENNAIGLFETAMAWWSGPERFDHRVEINGYEHIEKAHSEGKGIILVGAHYSTLDLGGFLIARAEKVCTLYRPHNNPLLNYFMLKGRKRFARQLIDNRSTRQLLRLLKKGEIVWLAPDQDMGPTDSIYVPFFGQDAATVPTISRLAKLTGADVMMFRQYRLPGTQGYELRISPPLAQFPSGDERADTIRINQELEAAILEYPAQYMWVHRRFKTHPKGKNHLYK